MPSSESRSLLDDGLDELESCLEQRTVIESGAEQFLLIDAPPGTGKTHVACARIARLLDQGVEPGNILLLSFTRTAVAELRARIGKLAQQSGRARGVRITTLDAEAWRLLYGFTREEAEKLFGSYDANIEHVAGLLKSRKPELLEYFGCFEHVIVDEAQDLTGARAELVRHLIGILPDECGVTIFADPAQAIFGFAEGDQGLAVGKRALGLLELLNDATFSRGKPHRRAFSRVYRTRSKKLLGLFLDVRSQLLKPTTDAGARYESIRTAVAAAAEGSIAKLEEAPLDDNTLVLYRRRIEVHLASSFLSSRGVRHRIRMSGVPICIDPWVGTVLSGIPTEELDRRRFEEAWDRNREAVPLRGRSPDAAWAVLEAVAGSGRGVDGVRLRSVLARSRPPDEVCVPDLGTTGPILGTIHASKGREAPVAYLMLPNGTNGADLEEESRVLFVGATRARERLLTGTGYSLKCGSLGSGRVFRFCKGQAQVEFGRPGDVDATWGASREVPGGPLALQSCLIASCGADFPLEAKAKSDWDWEFALRANPAVNDYEGFLGRLSPFVKKDLWEIANRLRLRRTPTSIVHLWSVGIRTVVLPEDHAEVGRLAPPYSRSGVFLAPVIKGFTKVWFPERRK